MAKDFMSDLHNLFDTLQKFDLGDGRQGRFYSLPALEKAGIGPVSRLPVSIRLVLAAVLRMGKNPKMIEPLVPVDLVVDHSVQVDFAGSADALRRNLEIEFQRNC